MTWLRRLFNRRMDNSSFTSATRRPLYIPNDAPKKAVSADGSQTSESAELRLLEDSELAKKEVDDTDFDPYNTGAFNRSRSWEKISKQKTR